MGPSGSGKSTLLHCLAGILRPDARRGPLRRPADRRPERARPNRPAARDASASCSSSASSCPSSRRSRTWRCRCCSRAGAGPTRIAEADAVVRPPRHRRPRRPAGPASSPAARPSGWPSPGRSSPRRAVLFADEPTGSLDSLAGERVMDLLVDTARAAGTTVILVTHEARIAAYADREVIVRDGRVHRRRWASGDRARRPAGGERRAREHRPPRAHRRSGSPRHHAAAPGRGGRSRHPRPPAPRRPGSTPAATGRRRQGDGDPLLWHLDRRLVDGREMLVLRVAATGPGAPVPLGLPTCPSPARSTCRRPLARLIEELPADRLADRFPCGALGHVARRAPGRPRRAGGRGRRCRRGALEGRRRRGGAPRPHRAGAVPVHRLPPPGAGRRRGRPAGAGRGLRRRPRPASGRPGASSASPPCAWPGPRRARPTVVAAVEAGAAAAVGAVLGVAGYLAACAPTPPAIEIDGHESFVADVRVAPVLLWRSWSRVPAAWRSWRQWPACGACRSPRWAWPAARCGPGPPSGGSCRWSPGRLGSSRASWRLEARRRGRACSSRSWPRSR